MDAQGDSLLRTRDVVARLGLSPTEFHRRMSAGRLTLSKIHLGPRCVRYSAAELEQLIANLRAQRVTVDRAAACDSTANRAVA